MNTFGKQMRFHVAHDFANLGSLALRAVLDEWTPQGARRSIVLPMELRQLRDEDGGHEIRPFCMLNPEEAQQLMDALWTAGLRPTEGTGSAGALAATQAHLQDLRHLVFKTKPKNT